MKKRIRYGFDALSTLRRGTGELAHAVGITYGPHGGKVAVSKLGKVVITTDGAALGKECQFGDLRRLGVSLVRSASDKADGRAGDGTSTAAILTDSILSSSMRCYTHKWDVVSLVREIREALTLVEKKIQGLAVEATEDYLRRVAFMSSHGDEEISNAIVQGILTAGENGTVLLVKSEGVGIEFEMKEGLTVDSGYMTSEFSGGLSERVMDGPLVAVVSTPLEKAGDIQPLMEEASQWPGRGLVVFAPGIYGEALALLTLNNQKGVLPSCAVTVKFRGSAFDLRNECENIAVITGATVVDRVAGMDVRKFESGWLGAARKITVSKNQTVIVSYMDEPITKRVDARIEALLALADKSRFDYERDRYHAEAASLDGGLCLVKVGGYTELEAVERRSRAEDTLHAVQQCLENGVVPGAGWSFLYASQGLPDTEGGRIVRGALEAPLSVLASRAGAEGAVVVTKSRESPEPWTGFDPVTGVWRDFREDPAIIDPLDVVLSSLHVAGSVACEVLLTGAVVHSR